MTTDQHDSKTEGRGDLVHIRTDRGLWRPNAEGYTNDKRDAGRWLRSEAERITRHLGPEKCLQLLPVELGRGDVLARQERMTELRVTIAYLEQNNLGGRHIAEIGRLSDELSRLRNEGGGDCPGYTECEALGKTSCSDCKPSDLPAREAIERPALIENIARKCMAEWIDLNQASKTAPDFREYRKILERGINEALAALQPLSQGNGEAVAWQYRFHPPGGTWGAWSHTLDPECYRQRTDCEVRPLYAAPPSQSEGVREALEAAIGFIATEYRDSSYEPEGEWLPPEARRVHHKLCEALYTTTPSPGLVEAAEWRAAQCDDGTWIVRSEGDVLCEIEPNGDNRKEKAEFIAHACNALRTLSAKGGAG